MANNCYNYLEIEGTEEDIKRLERCIEVEGTKENKDYDMRKVIPIDSEGNGFYKGNICKLWGTKWFDGECFENSGTSATLSFDTAWSPSLPVTLEMSLRFNLKINHSYEESGCDFEGDYNVENGNVVLDEERPYRPICDVCEKKFDRDEMTYDEDDGTFKCKRCGDELTGLMMDKLDKINKERNKL